MSSSDREKVVSAALALVKAALPNASPGRNRDRPEEVGPGGAFVLRDGSPGEAEVTLSPLTYHYEHRMELDVAAYASSTNTAEAVLDQMLSEVGAAVAADRTLGGLCDWLDCEAPEIDDLEPTSSTDGRWASATLVASYSTSSPL